MDGPRLAAIEKVSVKTSTDCPDETETEHFLKVETVRRYNDTALVFLMANNQALFVWNGETVYVDANGTSYPVCEATATCAALYVDDNDEKEQLEEKANAALEAGGFTEAAARGRRDSESKMRCLRRMLEAGGWRRYKQFADEYCRRGMPGVRYGVGRPLPTCGRSGRSSTFYERTG